MGGIFKPQQDTTADVEPFSTLSVFVGVEWQQLTNSLPVDTCGFPPYGITFQRIVSSAIWAWAPYGSPPMGYWVAFAGCGRSAPFTISLLHQNFWCFEGAAMWIVVPCLPY